MTIYMKVYFAAVGIAVAAAVVVSLNSRDTANDTQRNVTFDIRQSQFDACINSSLREDVRKEFVDLKRDVLIPILENTGASIDIQPNPSKPPMDAVAYLKHRIQTIEKRIPDPDCEALYPALDGQDLKRQDVEQNGSTKESSDDPDNGTPEDRPTVEPSDPLGPPSSGDSSGGGDGSSGGGAGEGATPDPPSDGGGGSTPAPEDPPQSPPSNPPPSLGDGVGDIVDGATGTVCGATSGLGLPVCLP